MKQQGDLGLIFSTENKQFNNYLFENDSFTSINYRLKDYFNLDSYVPKTANELVAWVLSQMAINSNDALLWMHKNQYASKSAKNDVAFNNKSSQILSFEFYNVILSNYDNIVKMTQRLEDVCNDVGEYSISLYKMRKKQFVSFITKKFNVTPMTITQFEWFYDGIMKHLISGIWQASQYAWEVGKPYEKIYIFRNKVWSTIS